MIEVGDPADLALAVQAFRKSRGITRISVAKVWAEQTGRHWTSSISQMQHWELKHKVPNLASVGDYLRAHGLRMALLQENDPALYVRCPATLRGDITQPCAIADGHVGTHRTFKGREFW